MKPLNAAQCLPAAFTAEQLTRLYATFPVGVCDWGKLGLGQQPAKSPLTLCAGPGGRPLGRAPGSQGAGHHGD